MLKKFETKPIKIGVQLFWVEIGCYKHVKVAIEKIEAEGHTVMSVMPLADYDAADGTFALRAVLITVAAEARPLKEPKTNAGAKDKNTA